MLAFIQAWSLAVWCDLMMASWEESDKTAQR